PWFLALSPPRRRRRRLRIRHLPHRPGLPGRARRLGPRRGRGVGGRSRRGRRVRRRPASVVRALAPRGSPRGGRADRGVSTASRAQRTGRMQLEQAIRVLEALADGRDPDTGAPLPPDSVGQRPQVVRALYTAIQELKRAGRRGPDAGAGHDNAGKPWGAPEEAELLRGFEAGAPLTELAKKHGRTVAAIHGRLYLLGKLPVYGRPPRRT